MKYLVTRYETYVRTIKYEVVAEDEDVAADMDYDSDKLLYDRTELFYDEADAELIREEVIIEEPEDNTNTPLW